MKREKVTQNHRYELRKARVIAYRLAQKVYQYLTDFWQEDADLLPMELSVNESFQGEMEDGKAETTFSFRFEGGLMVRLKMIGYPDKNYGIQWNPHSAYLRFYPRYDPWDLKDPEVVILGEDIFKDGKHWVLPQSENSKVLGVVLETLLDGTAGGLNSLETKIREATQLDVRGIEYKKAEYDGKRIEFTKFSFSPTGKPEVSLQVQLLPQQWEMYGDALSNHFGYS